MTTTTRKADTMNTDLMATEIYNAARDAAYAAYDAACEEGASNDDSAAAAAREAEAIDAAFEVYRAAIKVAEDTYRAARKAAYLARFGGAR